jgi:hypothetical protein
MGKGVIKSGGTGGQYQVELTLSRDRIALRISRMTAQIVQIEILILSVNAEIATTNSEISTLKYNILVWKAETDPEKKAKADSDILTAMKSLEQKYNILRSQQGKRALLELKKTALERRIAYLSLTMPGDETVSAWCGDLTEDLSGNVGTIEVSGERGTVYIRPGFNGGAVYDEERDGQLQPSIAGTPESVFYNLALLPGWQKWMPTYRSGVISSISGDICDVDLDAALSSIKAMNVNQSASLTGVPIVYMD